MIIFKNKLFILTNRFIDLLILTACQPVYSNLCQEVWESRSYLYFCVVDCFEGLVWFGFTAYQPLQVI